jgi:hypothetical protein
MRALAALSLVAAAGCAPALSFPTPYSTGALARDSQTHPAPALIHYLGQADADPEVCDLGRAGDRLARADEQVAKALLDAMLERRISPDTWRRCQTAMLPRLPEVVATAVLDRVAARLADLLPDAEAGVAERVSAESLVRLLCDRPPEVKPSTAAMDELVAELDDLLADADLGRETRRLAAEMKEAVDLERGAWLGERVTPVSLGVIDDLALLRRFALRLPTPALQRAARRRIIDLKVAASTFAEVKARPEAVVEVVLEKGRNPVPLAQTAVRRAWVEAENQSAPQIRVRQDLQRQRATLFAVRGGDGDAALVPVLPMRGRLFFELTGISRPVTVCASAAELEPDPCVEATELDLGNPAARWDEGGAVRLRDDVPLADLAALLDQGERFTLRPAVAGKEVLTLELALAFEQPNDLLVWAEPGRTGPKLAVRLAQRGGYVVVWAEDLSQGSRPKRVAIVPRNTAERFHVASRGGDGLAGTAGNAGSPGSRGSNGTSAMCPSSPGGRGGDGGPGGRGGNGGPGGPGGDGGPVRVVVECQASTCAPLTALARAMVQSLPGRGGPGGPGGAGGRGGDGGSGGSGTTCYNYNAGGTSTSTSLPGGSSGSKGADGPSGSPGAPGPDGQPGSVAVESRPPS